MAFHKSLVTLIAFLGVALCGSCLNNANTPTDTYNPSAEEPPPPEIILISPRDQAVLDNTRMSLSDRIVWEFDWSDVYRADSYNLCVTDEMQNVVLTNVTVPSSFYRFESKYYHVETSGYSWQVRAKVGGTWSNWTEKRTFELEPIKPFESPFLARNGKIAFTRNSGIWAINPDGTGLANLSNAPLNNSSYRDASPAWSPDGTKIAFSSNRQGILPEIYTMNSDGDGITRLTFSRGSHGLSPAWSPDGSKIAFDDGKHIFCMNSDGSDLVRVTDGTHPAWSPDGTKIAFVTYDHYKTYILNLNDGSLQNLNNRYGWDSGFPEWSPDGKKIAIRVVRDNSYVYCIMNISDGTLQDFPYPPDARPAWSPDGSQMAFVSWDQNQGYGIRILDLTTGQSKFTGNVFEVQGRPSDLDWQPLPVSSE